MTKILTSVKSPLNKISLNILCDTHIQGPIIIMVVDGKAVLRRAFKAFSVTNILHFLVVAI